MKAIDAGKEFKKKANAILEDRTKSHLMVDLLTGLESDSSNTILPAIHAVAKVIVGLIRRGDLKVGLAHDPAKPPSTPAEKYSLWILEVYETSKSKILSLMISGKKESVSTKRIQELALNTCMQMVAAIQETQQEPDTTHWSSETVKLFRSLLLTLCSENIDTSDVTARFTDLYLIYHDVKQYTIQGLAKLVKKCQNTRTFQSNLMKILEGLNFSTPKGDISTFLCQKNFLYEHEIVRKAFNSLWEDFMKLGNRDFDVYKRILIIIHDKVMPNLSRPLLLTDFLMESYNVGGSVSLLALNGVFNLIQNHNLEYPEFYTKLYKLLTPDVLHVKYRARFFYLADLFLMSTHLPGYVVAAFVKRLSRLALTAPANAILMVLPFIGNLLIRHKGLADMISRNCTEEDDLYNFDEQIPAKTRAVESGLWEVRNLQSHVLPQVAQSAKFINKPLPDMEWNLADYLEISMADMMQKETKKRIFVNVPLTFDRPEGLKFSKQEDIVSTFFEFA